MLEILLQLENTYPNNLIRVDDNFLRWNFQGKGYSYSVEFMKTPTSATYLVVSPMAYERFLTQQPAVAFLQHVLAGAFDA